MHELEKLLPEANAERLGQMISACLSQLDVVALHDETAYATAAEAIEADDWIVLHCLMSEEP